jgi:hypothetical protein
MNTAIRMVLAALLFSTVACTASTEDESASSASDISAARAGCFAAQAEVVIDLGDADALRCETTAAVSLVLNWQGRRYVRHAFGSDLLSECEKTHDAIEAAATPDHQLVATERFYCDTAGGHLTHHHDIYVRENGNIWVFEGK